MFNLPFDPNKPIVGTASVVIQKSVQEVFTYIGEHFFDNYPQWATDVIEFEALDGKQVIVGAKAKQLRLDHGKEVLSVFEVHAYQPLNLLALKGITAEYQDCYQLAPLNNEPFATQLTYTFELLNIELFMRPFEKLIRIAIEDGAETTAENIKQLLV